MAGKKTEENEGTDLRLKLPDDLKRDLRRFRAKRSLADQPITSDAKALLYVARVGLKHERI